MKHYLLLPEDSIDFLPEEDGAEAAISVFCERTMIVFPCSKLTCAAMARDVTEDRLRRLDCLELTARDALFDVPQQILIPVTRPDYKPLLKALQTARPDLFAQLPDRTFAPETCDQTGSHLHRHE